MTYRKAAASVLLLVIGSLHGWAAASASAAGPAFHWLAICSAVFAAGYGFALFALVRGYFWARWLGLGIGVVGLINVATYAALVASGSLYHGGAELWWIGLQGVAFVALVAALVGRSMVAAYDEKPSPLNRWRFSSPAVRLLRWAVVLNIAALPMLLKYAGNHASWMSCSVRSATFAVGAVLLAGIALVVLQRTAGLLLLLAGGIGTMALASQAGAGLVALLSTPLGGHAWCGGDGLMIHQLALLDTALVSTAFVPGALAAFAAFAAFLTPMARFLRGA